VCRACYKDKGGTSSLGYGKSGNEGVTGTVKYFGDLIKSTEHVGGGVIFGGCRPRRKGRGRSASVLGCGVVRRRNNRTKNLFSFWEERSDEEKPLVN